MKRYLSYFFPWIIVRSLIEKQLCKTLGKEIRCKIQQDAYDYWSLDMEGYRMEESEIRSLAKLLSVAVEDYLDTLPEEGTTTVPGLGLGISSALLSRATGLQWEQFLAEADGLWLIGCRKISLSEVRPRIFCINQPEWVTKLTPAFHLGFTLI